MVATAPVVTAATSADFSPGTSNQGRLATTMPRSGRQRPLRRGNSARHGPSPGESAMALRSCHTACRLLSCMRIPPSAGRDSTAVCCGGSVSTSKYLPSPLRRGSSVIRLEAAGLLPNLRMSTRWTKPPSATRSRLLAVRCSENGCSPCAIAPASPVQRWVRPQAPAGGRDPNRRPYTRGGLTAPDCTRSRAHRSKATLGGLTRPASASSQRRRRR